MLSILSRFDSNVFASRCYEFFHTLSILSRFDSNVRASNVPPCLSDFQSYQGSILIRSRNIAISYLNVRFNMSKIDRVKLSNLGI